MDVSRMFGNKRELREIKALDYAKDKVRKVDYKRISKNVLTVRKLSKIWKLAHSKKKPKILEDDEYLYFQYPTKPVILIHKENGKLYSAKEPNKWIQHQAYIVLAVLDSFGFVEGYKRHLIYKRPKNLWGSQ